MLFQLIELIIVFSFVELVYSMLQACSASGGLDSNHTMVTHTSATLLLSLEINSSLSAKISLIQTSLCCMKLYILLRILIYESAAPLDTSNCEMLGGH